MTNPHSHPGPEPAPDNRRGLAILCGELTPYRVHFHRRVALEVPELRLWTVLFRDSAWSAWKIPDDPLINVVKMGEGDHATHGTRNGGLRSQLRRSSATIDFLRSHRIAAVLCNGYDELPQLRSIRWCRSHGVPVMMWADSNIKADKVSGIKRMAKRMLVPRVLKRCDALLACGRLGREYFLRYGARADRIFLSPVEPDYDQLQNQKSAPPIPLPEARYRFVVSSRLVDYKRVDDAIGAFLAIAESIPLWDLIILGDGPEMARLRAMVPPSMAGRVVFTGFLGQQEQVTAIYRASHVLVHPASYEPWALVINEAAAGGLAIISSDVVGASAELVRDGLNGFLVPACDRTALAIAMRKVADPSTLQTMRRASVEVLDEWRRNADPVQGLRSALEATGALPTRTQA